MKWGSRLLALALLLLPAAPARAHVGSPNVFFDGNAGPYPVRVIVRPPAVIPGVAEITVRVRGAHQADLVTVQPRHFKSALKRAPSPDAAEPVPGAPGVYSGRLWLMMDGSWSVRVLVAGREGKGIVQIPVPAVRSRILRMSKGLGAILAGLGLFLFAGAVSIIGAAVREASLLPGEEPDGRRLAKARDVAILVAFLLILAVWGGKKWWDSTDLKIQQKLFKPYGVRTTAQAVDGRPVLTLSIEDRHSQDWAPLIPDHGKLMHLFLLREPGLDVFAHLHPVAQGEKDFMAALPVLPSGEYRVYADVVDENGFAQTLVGRVQLPADAAESTAGAAPAPDPDDSWCTAPAAKAKGSPLEDGGTMVWQKEPLAANREVTLRFAVQGPDGRPAALEPYMGMRSHAVITRDDGKVFVHLHPMGTVNMAAQEVFAGKSCAAMAGMLSAASKPATAYDAHFTQPTDASNVLLFPYEFPRPGRYRLWVQVKSGGRILTGVFATEVTKG